MSFSTVSRLKDTRVLTFCGMMGALAVILGLIATIKIGPYIRIGFSGIPNQIVDYLFGPWVGAIFAGAMDIVKWFISGDGDFFFGYTVTAITGAVIYGIFTYNKPVKLWRVVVSQLIVKVFCNLFMNTLWSSILYGKGFFAILPPRIISNAVMLPIDVIIMYLMLNVSAKLFRPYFNG